MQDGCTALMVHAESGNVGVVSRLLASHAFMDAQDMVGIASLASFYSNFYFSIIVFTKASSKMKYLLDEHFLMGHQLF